MKTFLIGSSDDCDIVVAGATVAPQHCRLIQDGRQWMIDDLGSEHGTFVGDRRIDGIDRVSPGDPVMLGRVVMPWPVQVSAGSASLNRLPWAISCALFALILILLVPQMSNRNAKVASDNRDRDSGSSATIDSDELNARNNVTEQGEIPIVSGWDDEEVQRWLSDTDEYPITPPSAVRDDEMDWSGPPTPSVSPEPGPADPKTGLPDPKKGPRDKRDSKESPNSEPSNFPDGNAGGTGGGGGIEDFESIPTLQPPFDPSQIPNVQPGVPELLIVTTQTDLRRMWTDNRSGTNRFAEFLLWLTEPPPQPVRVELSLEPGLQFLNFNNRQEIIIALEDSAIRFIRIEGDGSLNANHFQGENQITRDVRYDVSVADSPSLARDTLPIRVLNSSGDHTVVLLPVNSQSDAGEPRVSINGEGAEATVDVINTIAGDGLTNVTLTSSDTSRMVFAPPNGGNNATVTFPNLNDRRQVRILGGPNSGEFSIDVAFDDTNGDSQKGDPLTGINQPGSASLIDNPLRILALFRPDSLLFDASPPNSPVVILKRIAIPVARKSAPRQSSSVPQATGKASDSGPNFSPPIVIKRIPLDIPPPSKFVLVPELTNLQLDQAKRLVSEATLTSLVPNRFAHSNDLVLGQKPVAGTRVAAGSEVRISPVVGVVPDLIGMKLGEAIQRIQDEDYKPIFSRDQSVDLQVTYQEPAAGTQRQRGQTVKAMSLVRVPNVVRLGVTTARTKVLQAKLKPSFARMTLAEDTVLQQSPVAGKLVAAGSRVRLLPGARVPNVTGKTKQEADELLREVRINGSILYRKTQTVQSKPVPEATILSQDIAAGAIIPRSKSVGLKVEEYRYRSKPTVIFVEPPPENTGGGYRGGEYPPRGGGGMGGGAKGGGGGMF